MQFDEIPLGRAEDLTNQQFGFLIPLYRTHNIGKHTAWKCKCIRDNNLVNVRIDHLKEGRVISCGCYASEKAKQHMIDINYKGKNMKDITGLRSGYLIALEPINKRKSYGIKDSRVVWKCQCLNPIHTIPVFCEVSCTDITTKNKTSCGCINSRGEALIANWLTLHNIIYESQKTFSTCRFPTSNYLAKFDFYLPQQDILIEYNGTQHYKEKCGWNEPLKDIQARDNYKIEWCNINNKKLIIIPYTQLSNIEIILETQLKDIINYDRK